MEVSVQPLEARVEVRSERDQEELDVERLEIERADQPPQADVGPGCLRRVGIRLDGRGAARWRSDPARRAGAAPSRPPASRPPGRPRCTGRETGRRDPGPLPAAGRPPRGSGPRSARGAPRGGGRRRRRRGGECHRRSGPRVAADPVRAAGLRRRATDHRLVLGDRGRRRAPAGRVLGPPSPVAAGRSGSPPSPAPGDGEARQLAAPGLRRRCARPTTNGALKTRSSDGLSSPPMADQTSAMDRSGPSGRATLIIAGSGCSASAPVISAGPSVSWRRNAPRQAERRRCSSSGRCVQAVTMYWSL